MSITRPKVSFVTVNYRSAHLIRHLLQSVQDAALAFDYEYIVVDCGGGDGLQEMIETKYPWVTYLSAGGNVGFGRGNNLALEQATGQYIALVNPDVLLFSGELERWVQWMDESEEVAISGPRTTNPDGSDQDNCYAFPSIMVPVYRRTILGALPWAKRTLDRYLLKTMNREQIQDVDWIMGSAMLIRRPILEALKGFDDRFFMYFEDTDLCRRAWEAGHKVTYYPHARIVHYHKRESRLRTPLDIITNRIAREHIKSALYYFAKHRGKPHPRVS
ncbi:MAG: glycosyltransferase family 2 protein [Candidatus Magasanikbacteria bacterium]|nr:glycosyltransferase family 2 protein [Candidatus Magasanikbacteria bacterium]